MKQEQQRAIEMREQGMTYKAIAQTLKVKIQTIQSWVKPTAAIYREIKERAAGHCERCTTLLNRGGELHHGSDGKLHYLCRPCHRRVHHRITVSYHRSRSQTITAERFRSLRKQLGLSQIALAKKLDINYVTIHRWEKGIVKVPRTVELAMFYLGKTKGK
jgi:DNA-binding transcriptional regulator YiaG